MATLRLTPPVTPKEINDEISSLELLASMYDDTDERAKAARCRAKARKLRLSLAAVVK